MIRGGFIAVGWVSETDDDARAWLEESATVVYAFDMDETLEVSNGPVKLFDLVKLRERGHIEMAARCDTLRTHTEGGLT